jgi:hypothetical protein
MENENLDLKVIDDLKSILDQLPVVQYGVNAIQYLNANSFGAGQAGFDALKNAFNGLDLTEALNSTKLNQKITNQQKALDELEKKHASLVAIFGEDGGASEGTLTHRLVETLEVEINSLVKKRNDLLKKFQMPKMKLKLSCWKLQKELMTLKIKHTFK